MTDQPKTSVEKLAEDVTERIDTVESDRAQREKEVELTRIDVAAMLEEDRKQHNIRLEERLKQRTREINRRFLVLFIAMALIFGLLSYRTEVNANSVEQGFYEACLVRQDRQVIANSKREALAQTAMNGPNAPKDQAAKEALGQQLRDALLLPVEDCGEAP